MLIRVIDLETTGIDPAEHGVCEIGFADLISTPDLMLSATSVLSWEVHYHESLQRLVDPMRPIPPETSAVHHIIDEDVIGQTPWNEVALDVCQPGIIEAFAAHSAKFERGWLDDFTGARPWICTYKCALRLWPDAPSHSNQALRYHRRPEGLDRAVANVAHRAGPDAYVTAFHLRDMLALAPIEDLIAWSAQPALQIRCHIGKWRGRLWREVDFGFLEWVSQRDFDEDVIFTVRHEMERREREWQQEREASQPIAADDF
jgi:exodeoxyribonuclease X